MSLSTWNLHSFCDRYFLNLPQGVCGIEIELSIYYGDEFVIFTFWGCILRRVLLNKLISRAI